MAARKKLLARKALPETKTQKERFIEATRKAEATEDPAEFDRAFGRAISQKSTAQRGARKSAS